MAAHLAAAVEALAFDGPVDVAGHSMGGGIALRIGATRPDLVPAVQRHPLAALGAALAAWRADLLHDVVRVSGHGIRCVLSFADQDTVVVPGAIPQVVSPYVRCETVPGRHSWLLTDPRRFADTMLLHLGLPLPTAA
jgi:pimeloyl-ACP methyl ester carboxylesterase